MQENLQNKSEEYVKKNRRKSIWKRVVQILACVVVFCTTYALILPAITMEQKTFCGLEEHVHTQKCYRENPVASELICPLVEGEIVESELASVSDSDATVETITPHVHTEDCYAVPEVAALTCELEENEEHSHDFLCYGKWELVCEKTEHTHSYICFSDPEADVESEAVWENMVWNMDLSGIWAEDVVEIAKSQLGYKESVTNYQMNEDTSVNGYTRYGAWGKKPYADWDALFASFCFYYSGVEGMPLGEDCDTWVQDLSSMNLYFEASEHVPEAGDLLFIDYDGNGSADRVAIINEYIAATGNAGAQVKTIQGNVENQVQSVNYSLDNAQILGYGILPNQPAPVRSYTYSDEEIWVKVKLPVDTTLPKDAQLQVTAVEQESAQYDQLFNQAQSVTGRNVIKAQFYDISFYTTDCEYIEVSEKAKVMMRFAEDIVSPRDKTVVLHYDNEDDTPIVLKDVSVVEKDPATTMTITPGQEMTEYTNTLVSYETEGFSVFGLVELETTSNGGSGSGDTGNQGSGSNGGESNEEVITETYVTRVLDTNEVNNLYENVKSAGSKIFMIHGNLNHQQKKTLTSTIENNILKLRDIKEKEEHVANGYSVTSLAYQDQLWRFTVGEQENTYYIEAVAQPGRYLSLVTIDNKQVFSITEDKQLVEISFNNIYDYFFKLSINGKYMNWNHQNEFTVGDNTSSGIYLSEYTGSFDEPEQGGGETPPEEPEVPEEPEKTVDLVTNLGGKILNIIAVNNDDANFTAITSELVNGTRLDGSIVDELVYDNGQIKITDDDNNNNTVWEFVSTGTPGSYYIKAANYFGIPENESTGKYLRINSWGLTLDNNPQAIQVVTGIAEEGYEQDVVCLRVNEGGTDYYIQLENNQSSQDFISTGANGNQGNTADNRANHFVLAELTGEDKTKVDAVISAIDELPATKAEFENRFANEPQDNKTSFADQNAYRLQMREKALEAKEALDSLTSQQQNFVGKERIDKLLTELEFLWRKEPNIVTPANINARVKLFNYGANINVPTDSNYIFYNWEEIDKVIDGRIESTNRTAPTMNNLLGEDGYPLVNNIGGLNNLSLAYLFNDANEDPSSLVMTHAAVMENGGGLFQLDKDGYYYYYADTNAAWYNPTKNHFELYDVAVKPEYVLYRDDATSYDRVSNFLPYNEVLGNVIYDDKFFNGQVVSSVDNETKVDTAYLNAPIDLWFGMSIEYNFFIPKDNRVNGEDMVFEFHGDDDVFVYVDDVLVLNMGGIHEARTGSINFTNGTVSYDIDEGQKFNTTLQQLFSNAGKGDSIDETTGTLDDYTMHNLKFFYLERGGTYSYAGIRFNMPALPENTLSVGKDIDVNGSYIDAKLDYTFRLASVNSEGKVVDESFIITGKPFDIYDMATQVDTGRDGVVKADGTFTLKAGELAVFPNLLEVVDVGKKHFVVQEILPNNVKGQYDNITYAVNGEDAISLSVPAGNANGTHGYIADKPQEGVTTYQTDVYSIESEDDNFAHRFEFTNNVDESKLDTLNIQKLAAEGSDIDPNKEFQIQVKVGNDTNSLIWLPSGTNYTLNGAERTVGENGVIALKVGDIATIKGFLAGTYWEIEEILSKDEQYIPTYTGASMNGSSTIINGNAGTFGVGETGDTVQFTVTNQLCDVLLQVPLSKTAIGNRDSAAFHFEVERGTWQDGNWTKLETVNGTSITVNDANKTNGTLSLSIQNGFGNQVFYKISEQNSEGDFIYDDTFYIVEVTISDDGSGNEATIANIWKNGTEQISNASSLDFVNYKTYDVTISKTVINSSNSNDHGGNFSFEARIELNDLPFTKITSGSGYTVENGVIRFNLKHEESIAIPVPVNGTIIVTETNNVGCQTSYQVTQGGLIRDVENGISVEVTDVVGDAKIDFYNQIGYELPATGGSGTHGFVWCGLLMILAAGGLLLYKAKVKSKN